MKNKLVFLSPVLPYPPMSGGEHYPYHLARELSREFDVHFVCFEKVDRPYSSEQVEHMENFVTLHRLPLQKVDLVTRIFDLFRPHYFKGHRNETIGRIEKICEGAKVVHFDILRMAYLLLKIDFGSEKPFTSYFTHNFEIEIFRQLLIDPSRGLRKVQAQLQGLNLRRVEKKIIDKVDTLVCISKRDAEVYGREFGIAPKYANNGVDTKSIEYKPRFSGSPIFIGSLIWGPNSIGLEWFLEEVFPKLEKYSFKIVGRTQPGMDLNYIRKHKSIELIESPPSVLPYLYEASYSLAPLLDGSGTRGKILESMAAGKPVISTTKGAEGLDVTPEEDILIADTPEEFMAQVKRIESDEELYNKLAEKGRKFVEEQHDWSAIGQVFIDLYKSKIVQPQSR